MTDLEQAKRRSAGQLLLKAARLFNELAIERARDELGTPDLRVAHTALFPHIDLAGTRLTELARRLGVTKQATLQLVDELVDMGMLDRIPDPDDGRAKLIVFRDGERGVLAGLAVFVGLEARLRRRLGKRRYDELQRSLADIVDLLETR